MADFELRDKAFLLVGLLAPVVYLLASRLGSSVSYSSLGLLDGAPTPLRVRLARLPALLLALAVLALAVALAGPRTGSATSRQQREGIAIAMVVDTSRSMAALDFADEAESKNRLEVVKEVFRGFVAGGDGNPGRPDDMIGLVGFGTWADGLCPLTLDHGNLIAILDELDLSPCDEGDTAIGEGLALAVERLRQNPARSKVAILLSDGSSNAGDVTPLEAADLAAANGIKVYTIGVGRTGAVPVPVTRMCPERPLESFGGQVPLRSVLLEIDEGALVALAERTGGRYFHATDREGLAKVVAEIDALERTELAEVRYLEYELHYAGFTGAALVLVALAALASGTLLRRLP
jgi:Ca-activated chloride channel family protein